jgi:hypothetical protein
MIRVAACLIACSLTVLGAPAFAQTVAPVAGPSTPPPAPASASASPAVSVAGALPAPPQGMGQVAFFRPPSVFGMVIWFNVRENGTALGKLTNGAWFVKTFAPGPHTFTAATENHNVLHMEVDDGETYYVRGSVQMGVLIDEANLAPSDEATFTKAFKHMHKAKSPAEEARADAK